MLAATKLPWFTYRLDLLFVKPPAKIYYKRVTCTHINIHEKSLDNVNISIINKHEPAFFLVGNCRQHRHRTEQSRAASRSLWHQTKKDKDWGKQVRSYTIRIKTNTSTKSESNGSDGVWGGFTSYPS